LQGRGGNRLTRRMSELGIRETQRAGGFDRFGCVGADFVSGGGTRMAQFVQLRAYLRAQQQQTQPDGD
jgi:hypothetical protein